MNNNRDIKFRVWLKNDKKMIKVTGLRWGDFGNGLEVEDIIGEWQENKKWKEGIIGDRHDTILMAYTGLKDKNGKGIYEGDVVKHEYYPADEEHGTIKEIEEIVYDKGVFGFRREYDVICLHDCMSLKNNIAEGLEKIGNIYENPQLTKQ